MDERWVVDASPLISLGAIGRLDLLTTLAEDVVVPEVVAREVLRIDDDASRAFAQASLRTEGIQPDDMVTRWGLGSGETAVLSAGQLLRQLEGAGLYLSPELIANALSLVGERKPSR